MMDRGHWVNLGFFFCDHRESGPRFNVSSEGKSKPMGKDQ